MSNINNPTLLDHLRHYLQNALTHILAFSALTVLNYVIANPGALHSPLLLFFSLLSLFFTTSTQLQNYHQAYNIHTLNMAAEPKISASKLKQLYYFNWAKTISLISANLLLSASSLIFMAFIPFNTVAIASSLAVYHLIHSLKDYLSTPTALDFINRYFQITLNNHATEPIRYCTFTAVDPWNYRLLAVHMDEMIAERYQLSCQLSHIPNLPIDTTIQDGLVLREPVLLTLKSDTTQSYWVDRNNLLKNQNIHVIRERYHISHEHDPETQEKIQQIRAIMDAMSNGLTTLRDLQVKLRDINCQEAIQSYRQAIINTADEYAPSDMTAPCQTPARSETPTQNAAHHAAIAKLDSDKEAFIAYCKSIGIRTLDSHETQDITTTMATASSSPLPSCAITGQTTALPIRIQLQHSKTLQTTTLYCDITNLLGWLDTDPQNNYEGNIEVTLDYNAIEAIAKSQVMPMPAATYQQLHHIQDSMTSDKPSNPIALLLKTYGKDSLHALSLMMDNTNLRSRIHDLDLLTTLSHGDKRYFSLSEYLLANGLEEHYALIVDQCYNVHKGLDNAPAQRLSQEGEIIFLMHKRWPMHRFLMIDPDITIDYALDLQAIDKLHQHAINVITHTLKPQLEKLCTQLDAERPYYIRSDNGFEKKTGEEINTAALLDLCLHSDRTTISPSPLDRESFMSGVHLNTIADAMNPPHHTADSQQNDPSRALFPRTPARTP